MCSFVIWETFINTCTMYGTYFWELDIWTFDKDNRTTELLDNWTFWHLNLSSIGHKFSFPKNQMSSSCYGEKTASSEFIFSALGASDRTLMAIKQPIIIFYYSKGTFLQCCVSRNLNIDRFDTIHSVWKKLNWSHFSCFKILEFSDILKQTCSKKLLI